MRYFFLLTLPLIILAGCNASSEALSIYLAANRDSSAKLEATSSISKDRRAAEYRITNHNDFDIVCDNISVRAIMDDPNSYLEVGERSLSLQGLFLRSGEAKQGKLRSDFFGNRTVHVRAMTLNEGGARCRKANIRDLCSQPELAPGEREVLARVQAAVGAKGCIELARLPDHIEINLTSLGDIPGRQIVYFSPGTIVTIDDTESNRRTKASLAER